MKGNWLWQMEEVQWALTNKIKSPCTATLENDHEGVDMAGCGMIDDAPRQLCCASRYHGFWKTHYTLQLRYRRQEPLLILMTSVD
jgi:hypothetical protein